MDRLKIKRSKRSQKTKQKPRLRGATSKVVQKENKIDQLKSSLSPNWLKRVVLPAALATCFLVIGFSLAQVADLKRQFVIEKVLVTGEFVHVNHAQVEAELQDKVGTNYFDLDIGLVKASLMESKWVRSVKVRREWPATLHIVIDEYTAIARWGENGLINSYGETFFPEQSNNVYTDELPYLNGGNKEAKDVLDTYLALSSIVKEADFRLKALEKVSDAYWVLGLEQGFTIYLDIENGENALYSFLEMYEKQLISKVAEIESVDMRYNNGFTVVLKNVGGVSGSGGKIASDKLDKVIRGAQVQKPLYVRKNHG